MKKQMQTNMEYDRYIREQNKLAQQKKMEEKLRECNLPMFVTVTGKTISDINLNTREKLLFSIIVNLTNTVGYCWASNEYLAVCCGCSMASVKRYLKTLKDNDYIKIETDKQKGNFRKIFVNKEKLL